MQMGRGVPLVSKPAGVGKVRSASLRVARDGGATRKAVAGSVGQGQSRVV